MMNLSEPIPRHANDGNERTVCGLAHDAYVTGFHDQPILIAQEGQEFTCADCRRVIAWHRKFRNNTQPTGAA